MTRDDYVVAHVRDALAADPRAGVLDVRPTVVAGRLVLTGTITTDERRRAVTDVAREAAGGLEVVDDLTVLDPPPAGASEEVPR